MVVKAAEKIIRQEQGKEEGGVLVVSAPNFKTATAYIVGTAPLMVHRFSKKAELMAKHQAGSRANRVGCGLVA